MRGQVSALGHPLMGVLDDRSFSCHRFQRDAPAQSQPPPLRVRSESTKALMELKVSTLKLLGRLIKSCWDGKMELLLVEWEAVLDSLECFGWQDLLAATNEPAARTSQEVRGFGGMRQRLFFKREGLALVDYARNPAMWISNPPWKTKFVDRLAVRLFNEHPFMTELSFNQLLLISSNHSNRLPEVLKILMWQLTFDDITLKESTLHFLFQTYRQQDFLLSRIREAKFICRPETVEILSDLQSQVNKLQKVSRVIREGAMPVRQTSNLNEGFLFPSVRSVPSIHISRRGQKMNSEQRSDSMSSMLRFVSVSVPPGVQNFEWYHPDHYPPEQQKDSVRTSHELGAVPSSQSALNSSKPPSHELRSSASDAHARCNNHKRESEAEGEQAEHVLSPRFGIWPADSDAGLARRDGDAGDDGDGLRASLHPDADSSQSGSSPRNEGGGKGGRGEGGSGGEDATALQSWHSWRSRSAWQVQAVPAAAAIDATPAPPESVGQFKRREGSGEHGRGGRGEAEWSGGTSSEEEGCGEDAAGPRAAEVREAAEEAERVLERWGMLCESAGGAGREAVAAEELSDLVHGLKINELVLALMTVLPAPLAIGCVDVGIHGALTALASAGCAFISKVCSVSPASLEWWSSHAEVLWQFVGTSSVDAESTLATIASENWEVFSKHGKGWISRYFRIVRAASPDTSRTKGVTVRGIKLMTQLLVHKGTPMPEHTVRALAYFEVSEVDRLSLVFHSATS